MDDREQYVFVPLEVSVVSMPNDAYTCDTQYLMSFFLFTVLLTMMCLQCRTLSEPHPMVVEARRVTADEKV